LNFESNAWSDKDEDRIPTREYVDFEREPGKVGNVFTFKNLPEKNGVMKKFAS
jgi:hypothetical protein